MNLYSTKNKNNIVSLKEAVMKSLPADNGLYMPSSLPPLDIRFYKEIEKYTFSELSTIVAKQIIGDILPSDVLDEIVHDAINFPAPLVHLNERMRVLELFHGPSLAFKDFGARFMARLMSHFNSNEDRELTILVATSGDTGGAVAAGFYKTPGINVVILYPKGKVSLLQEKQLTTLGHNITALEVDGTFDDCQAIVKKAFLDGELNKSYRLSSANSINIARLIPQSFYYFEAYKQVADKTKDVVFCIPSGNFGNLTAGLIAKRLGLPVSKFIAATNANNIVPSYLETGEYEPKPSVSTISNAMDVGNPSNFQRMEDLYGSTWNMMKKDIVGYSYTDEQTRKAIKYIKDYYGYTMDPHGAVGYLALDEYQKKNSDTLGIILETAHPAKFLPVMEPVLGSNIDIPPRLAEIKDKAKESVQMSIQFSDFKDWMLNR